MKEFMKENADKEQAGKIREHAEETDIRYRFTLAIRKFMEKHGIREEDYADKAEKLWESFEDRNKRAREMDPTARNYEEMLWNRLNPVRIKLDKLEKKPPSVKRFKDILRLMTSEVLADAARGRGEFISSDVLLKSFRLLAVTPKTLRSKSVKPDDLLFTRKECEECLKSYTLFIDAVLEEERAMLLRVPAKERNRLQKKSGDKPAENKTERKARLFAHLFEMSGTGKYRYTGKHFNYLINNRNKFKTVSTPDKVGTPDTLGQIFEYYIVRVWAQEKSRNNAKKKSELMQKFIDEVEIESCRDLFLNIYKSSKDTKAKLLAEQKATAPDDAKKLDDQIALADSLSKMMALELLRHKIDPDTAAQELAEGRVETKAKVEDEAPIPESRWKKWPKRPPRFNCDKACANVVDFKHTNDQNYREIRPYTNMPVSAQKAIRLLLAAASKKCEDDWWILGQDEDGKPFSQAFQPKANKAARRFYNDQIEVGGAVGERKGKWRILPKTMFDDNYRDKHPSADALSGS